MTLIVDLILGGALIEALVFARVARHLLPNLGAGLCLLLALRLALGHAAWPWLCLCLTGAGAAHLTDLRTRRK